MITFALVAIGIVIVFAVGMMVGAHNATKTLKAAAVAQGVAASVASDVKKV